MAKVALNQINNDKISVERYLDSLYDNTVANIRDNGNLKTVFFPLDLVCVDNSYQREFELSQNKVRILAENWDDNMYEEITISLHPEEKRGYVLDGLHRCLAARQANRTHLTAKILQDMPTDPTERRIKESQIFTDQEKYVERLTVQQKHKGYVLQNRKANVILDQLMQKYDFEYKKSRYGGRVKAGQLSGFSAALSVASSQGKEVLDDIFDIISKARWNMDSTGLSSYVIKSISNLYRFHFEDRKEMKAALIEIMRDSSPDQILSEAIAKYPLRWDRGTQITIHLEDLLHDKIGLEVKYKNTKPNLVSKNAA